MSKQKEISYKWVVFGGAIIIALYAAVRLVLAGTVSSAIIASYGPQTGPLMIAGIVAFVSYFVGGLVIGIYSPGETIREPAIATFMAMVPNLLANLIWYVENGISLGPWLSGTLIVIVVGLLMALGGAWIGEKLQGRTVEKLREQGELPPPPNSRA